MSAYRRFVVPGGTFFLTVATYEGRPILASEDNVNRLRKVLARVRQERPFDVLAAVILPDHAHFLWMLARGDTAYSARMGQNEAVLYPGAAWKNSLPSARQPHHGESIARVMSGIAASGSTRSRMRTISKGISITFISIP